MSRSRRPSVSIYDYPEHLNPFNDEITNAQPQLYRDGKTKDSKHKFWTFGRSRKKRSNSFSIKSTWNGLFGKRKDDRSEELEKRSTITTVSSTYKREPCTKPITAARATKDQQEFDEALGTLARRRKYTLDNSSSRYSSSLTVNGDPARIYDGSPQDTTTSIMGDLTPKPPARRFGQVSPKPTDKIPPLDYEDKSPKENGSVTLREKTQESTPVPPLRRFGNRSSQRTNSSTVDSEEEASRSGDVTLCDENENVPEDYVFKRFTQDAVRKSNLSINSCVSVGSTISVYGRKKRKAPQPPRRVEKLDTEKVPEVPNVELQIVEPSDIARVTENIHEMTKKSKSLDQEEATDTEKKSTEGSTTEDAIKCTENKENIEKEECTDENCVEKEETEPESSTRKDQEETDKENAEKKNEDVHIEYHRTSQENVEIIKDVDQVNSSSELEDVCLRRKSSSGALSRSDSFSVKDEIEKIEKQIKALETRNASNDSSDEKDANDLHENTRQSIQANRRHFFQNMVENENDKSAIKIEFKEYPREQKDIHVVRLNESPVPAVAPRDPVKVIELHISEPIKQKAKILESVNPIPKPRRHSSLNLNESESNVTSNDTQRSLESTRGKSIMADQGRGKSRGRARGQDDKHSQPRPPSQYPQPQGAWSRRPGLQPQPGPSSQTPYARPAQPPPSYSKVKAPVKPSARAVERLGPRGDSGPGYAGAEGGAEPMEVGGGGDVVVLGRGAMRGRRPLPVETYTRPSTLVTKKGSTGNAIQLQANFFKLLATTDWCLYQYRVDFAPEEDRTVVRKGLLRLHREKLGAYVFDGTVLYSSRRTQDKEEFWSVRTSDNTNIRITIRLVGEMQRADPQYLQFFNIIMRKCLELLKLQLVGRDYFDARSKVEVREFRLELWPGYLTSIRQHENDILMCAEVTHKVMRQQTLLDIMNDCYQQNSRAWKELFEKQVTGLVVLTDYNNNTYRISDVDFDTNPLSTFKLRSGESISYKDYYKNKYQIRIRNDSQPMLVTRLKPRERRAGQPEMVYLVPELCRATGLTDSMRENFHLMRALAEHTRISPKLRITKLMAFNRRLRSEDAISKELREWNLQLDDKLVTIPARCLQPEKIVLGGKRTVPAGPTADWTRELHNKALFNPAKLSNWVIIHMDRMRSDVERFIATLQESARGMGCRFEHPRFWTINDDRSNTYSDTLERIMSSSNPELVFCVVSNNRADRYSAIKKKCIIDRPVPSQVFLAKNLNSKGVRSIATKVAIQLTCKLGGAPWSMELPPVNLMVVGFDVCHDPNDKSRDYGAMVASLDKSLTRYFSAVSAHTTGEELSNEFSVNMAKALARYKDVNNCLPTHILIYRDGVGEGQVPYVHNHEIEQIKSKLTSVYGDTTVKMAFIIVTKRINTRFFYNGENPPPGTIVDDIVTNPMRYDFFIVSQSVRQGTVTPCAYNVIADTIGWTADQIQRVTYKLCHMYYNWSGTVRVPAPCQYAHKLAFMVAQFIRRPPGTQMETLLYYL
ncbi:piwi-like protein Siwi [Osmia lignaria lignaria]|uniref:piwi-like protein Siwi n=1 Tax=Osmia lignaria lignaria TaxID=1437193 RepID=UPI00402B2000